MAKARKPKPRRARRRSLAPWLPLAAGAALVLLVGIAVGAGLGRWLRPAAAPPAVAAVAPAPSPPATAMARRVLRAEPPPPLPVSLPLVPAPPPPPPRGEPAWLRFAVPAPAALAGKPAVAIVIDDMGVDRRRSERILALPGPLTTSYLTYAADLAGQARAARARGHELMMHLPMEPMDDEKDAGPDVLRVGQAAAELRAQLARDLGRLDGYVGINNHMGSRFTAFSPGMQVVMDELKRRGLLFLDSRTSAQSVGLDLARATGVPAASRDVFLDDDDEPAAIRAQLARVETIARRHGAAIAIGHPRDATIEALAAWLPTLQQRGLTLVPVSAIVRRTTRTVSSPGG